MAAREFLLEIVDGLKARGCSKARVIFKGPEIAEVEIEFAPAPAAAGFVDASGKPVDLDAGAGPLTRDPDEPPPNLETSDAALEQANFRPKLPVKTVKAA